MKIQEAAKQLNVSCSMLRYLEERKLVAITRNTSGYRDYTEHDLGTLQIILLYRKMGFSIEMISCLLQENDQKDCVRLFLSQAEILSKQIQALMEIRKTLEDCGELLFDERTDFHAVLEKMKNTSNTIQAMQSWKDTWNFDENAKSYDSLVQLETLSGLQFYQDYDLVLDLTAQEVLTNAGKVVEIGVGTGNLAKRLINHCSMIGVDQSLAMLMEAKRKLPQLPVKKGEFLQLPFEDRCLNTIVSSYAFHHCDRNQKRLAILEMSRTLLLQGRIIITDLMFENKKAKDNFERHCNTNEKRDLQDEFFANVDELIQDFNQAGFTCQTKQLNTLIWMITATKK